MTDCRYQWEFWGFPRWGLFSNGWSSLVLWWLSLSWMEGSELKFKSICVRCVVHSGLLMWIVWISFLVRMSSLFSDDCFVLRFVYEFVGLALCSVVWESIRTGCSMFFFQFAVLNLLFRLAFSLSEVAPHSFFRAGAAFDERYAVRVLG